MGTAARKIQQAVPRPKIHFSGRPYWAAPLKGVQVHN